MVPSLFEQLKVCCNTSSLIFLSKPFEMFALKIKDKRTWPSFSALYKHCRNESSVYIAEMV